MYDGAKWSPLGKGVAGGDVLAIAVGSDGEVYAGGAFSKAGGKDLPYIARWSGGAWRAMGAVDKPVRALVAYRGSVFAGGDFTSAGGRFVGGVARYRTGRGGRLGEWEGVGNGVDGSVYALALAAGCLYLGGAISGVEDAAGAGARAAGNTVRYCFADPARAEGKGVFNVGAFPAAAPGTVYAVVAAVPPVAPVCEVDAWAYANRTISDAERMALNATMMAQNQTMGNVTMFNETCRILT
ncbi:hypothetical protein T484DRAFT_2629007 [Baffinella frigidus]|nr:hypothetical protein T484DRAFT_2629007 [Cryptophyta sp. CCMP2293]